MGLHVARSSSTPHCDRLSMVKHFIFSIVLTMWLSTWLTIAAVAQAPTAQAPTAELTTEETSQQTATASSPRESDYYRLESIFAPRAPTASRSKHWKPANDGLPLEVSGMTFIDKDRLAV